VGKARQVTDSELILGKWKQADGSLTLTFFSNGTLREERMLNNGSGTWKIRSGKYIELEIEGVLWGTNQATCRYTLSGDELTLTPESGSGFMLRYQRVQ
jgi:hypothetical protein